MLNNFENRDDSLFYCLYIIANYSNDLMIFALNSIEKFVREKWDKMSNINEKILIRYFLVYNLNQRNNALKKNLSAKRKQYLLTSINKLNCIIILIASKDWPQSWPTLIGELCDRAKNDFSYESENCIKVLILLSEHLNKNYKKLMTAKKNIELSYQMYNELNKILDVIKYYIVDKSDEIVNFIQSENNNEIDINKNILEQTIKLFNEFFTWFEIDNILDKTIIIKLLSILKKGICQSSIIDCLGSLFKFEINKLEEENKEKLRILIFDIYNSFIIIFHNDIAKRNNFINQYEYIISNEKEKELGFESFTIGVENCLINFYKENFDFLKEKSIYNPEFLDQYNNSIVIGLEYLIQFANFKNDQIKNSAMEFWYFIVYGLFTLKKFIKNSNNSINEGREILVDYLKKSYIYNKCFAEILNSLRELLCENMTKPLEIKIILDENGDIISDPNDNDTFNQNLQETMQNVLIYLSLIEPELTKNFIIKKIVEEYNKDIASMNLNKINSLCWSSGVISGTMNEKIERDFVLTLCKIFIVMQKKACNKVKEVISYDLLFIISKYIRIINQNDEFPHAIIKKLFEFFQFDSEYVKDFVCETFIRLSMNNEDLIRNKEKYGFDIIEYIFKNWKDYTKYLNTIQMMMIYESLSNIISNITDENQKRNYFKKLMEKPHEFINEIITNKNRNINYLNNSKVMRIIRFFIALNERICHSFKKFYWLYGKTIFEEIKNIFIYYNDKLNDLINNNKNSDNGITRENYELINNSLLKYFTCLVKNINDLYLIKKDMIFSFGELLDKFSKSPNNNKNPNILLLFSAIVEVSNNNDYELNYKIWDFFSSNIFNLIRYAGDSFPELTQNFFILVNSLIINSIETFYYKYQSIPKILIDVLNYGTNSKLPAIYELSLETLNTLIEKILNLNINVIDQRIIIRQFFETYFDRIFYFVFGNMIDGDHQNGIKIQIKILRHLIENLDNENIIEKKIKLDFQKKLLGDLPKISNNLTSNQIQTFTLALFNYCNNEHYFEITIKDFLVSLNTFNKKEDAISEEEKQHQINLARIIEIKKYQHWHNNDSYNNISVENYRQDDFLGLNLFDSH